MIYTISGHARNGKDETAKIIKEQLELKGKKVVILHFADYLKEMLKKYKGWNGEKSEYWRNELQFLGTDIIRHKLNMPFFHVNRIVEDIKILKEMGYTDFLIPDCRFINEQTYMIANFPYETKTIRVSRLGSFENPMTEEQMSHPSEVDLDNFKHDYYIYAQSGLDHLKDETLRSLKDIL